MRTSGWIAFSIVLALPPSVPAQTLQDGFALAGDKPVAPGETIVINGTFEQGKAYDVVLHRTAGGAPITVRGTGAGESLSLILPATATFRPGAYHVSLPPAEAGRSETPVPGGINVQMPSVTLDSLSPPTRTRNKTFDFDLIGENFSSNACDADVTIDGQGSIVRWRIPAGGTCENGAPALTCDAGSVAGGPVNTGVTVAEAGACLAVESPRLMHLVRYDPRPYQGPADIRVRVGSTVAAGSKQLVFARWSPTAILILSGVAAFLLVYLVARVVGQGLSGTRVRVSGQLLSIPETFLFDPETNSYSLSKFQFLAFSATFLFSYLYVLLSQLFVQWQFALPDVPSTIAGILAISGGTAVASAGLTAARGSKGAGLQHPTGADLVSSGGVVVPERFQLFVWTIVSCVGFVALLVAQDPSKVTSFPEIPQGLLYVMGVSAAGYLGGKAARRPGPVLQNIAVTRETIDSKDFTKLILTGQNLGIDGRFFVDREELPIVPDDRRPKELQGKALITPIRQLDAVDANFAQELKIIIGRPDMDLTKGDHQFRIVNRDGQFADMPFSANHVRIDTVVEDPGGTPGEVPKERRLKVNIAEGRVLVHGQNFRSGSTVTWRNASGGAEVALTIVDGETSETERRVMLTPGPAGTGRLVMTCPNGDVDSVDVRVETPPLSGGAGDGTASTSTGQSSTIAPSAPLAQPPNQSTTNTTAAPPALADSTPNAQPAAQPAGQPAPDPGDMGAGGHGEAAPHAGPPADPGAPKGDTSQP